MDGRTTTRLEIRVPRESAELVRQAVAARGESVTGFVLEAAMRAAEEELAVEREALVPAGFVDEVLAALSADAAPPAELEELARRPRAFEWGDPYRSEHLSPGHELDALSSDNARLDTWLRRSARYAGAANRGRASCGSIRQRRQSSPTSRSLATCSGGRTPPEPLGAGRPMPSRRTVDTPFGPGRRPLGGDGNTGYTQDVAKVMVSLPDDLLRAVDMEADRRGTTRSGYLRELAEEALRRKSALRAQRMAEIDTMDGPPTRHGGGVAEIVKANRPDG